MNGGAVFDLIFLGCLGIGAAILYVCALFVGHYHGHNEEDPWRSEGDNGWGPFPRHIHILDEPIDGEERGW